MKLDDVKVGLHVRTNSQLGSTLGFMVVENNMNARRPDATGILIGYIPGHGGDCWWLKHGDETVAAYCFDEFEMLSPQPVEVA